MRLIHFEPGDKYWRKKFIRFPFDLYHNDPNWVPPLLLELRQIFNPRKHGFYQHGQAQFLLVVEDGVPVGRLVMLHNRGHDPQQEQTTGNFFLFETENNPDIAQILFDEGVKWAQDMGLKKIYGPKGMTPMDGLGLLVRGFEYRPAFGMPYNPAYYADFLRNYGFTQKIETESGYLKTSAFNLPEKIFKASELIQKRKGLQVFQMSSHYDLKRAISYLGETYNAALAGTEGNIPLSTRDLETMTQNLLWIAKPELIKIIMKDKKPVGFLLAYPDISRALQVTRGRLFPLGWLRVLWEKHHSEWLDINGIGIVEEFRGMAGTALLFSELYKSINSNDQFKHAEVIQIGTWNKRMRRELRGMGIDFYKKHAMFELEI